MRFRLSRDEVLAILRSGNTGDPEQDHARADEALLAYIGDDDILAAYVAIEKWYA